MDHDRPYWRSRSVPDTPPLRKTRATYYLQMLQDVAARSTCGRRAVGAILTTVDGKILSTGYNGPPQHRRHCTEVPCAGRLDKKGDTSRCEAVHAEINALLQCWRLDLAHTLYVSCTPCFTCAKAICNTQIKQIITIEEYADQTGLEMLTEAGIEVQVQPWEAFEV